MNKNKIDLIRQSLGAAESSIRLAKQLLGEIEQGTGQSSTNEKSKELPGTMGIFDGENMTTEKGENFPVPANYASKSLLVVGDTLKLVDEGKEKRFKQIEHVKRHKTLGILAKKDGKWKAVTPEGSYKVLPAAVSHFGGDIGSEVVLHLPAGNLTVPWGAIESVKNNKPTAEEVERVESPQSSAVVSEEVNEKPKEEKTEKKEIKAEKPEKKETPKEVKKEPAPKAVEIQPQPKAAAPILETPELEAPKPVVVAAKPPTPELAVVAKPTPTPPVVPAPAAVVEKKAAAVVTEEDELS